uniref:Uncharacterized protein n=1 Tax=Siphoviridae sp. ctLeG9 TaxID=2827848 RepID=A0A8S5RUQ6_9CAUD|nr:MAG TPA: hypothetical protein [Siphoviridae sp. ctLeG9]
MEMIGCLRFAESLSNYPYVFAHIQRVGFRFDEYAVKMCLKEKSQVFKLGFSEFGSPFSLSYEPKS